MSETNKTFLYIKMNLKSFVDTDAAKTPYELRTLNVGFAHEKKKKSWSRLQHRLLSQIIIEKTYIKDTKSSLKLSIEHR